MAKDMKSCPFCGVEVKKSNYSKHVRKVHSDLEDEELEKGGFARPAKDTRKKQREERKREEKRRQEKRREMRLVAVGIILIVIISVVGVFVYEYISKGGESGDGTIPNGGNGSGNPVAVMVTSMGTIKIELYEDDAPSTVTNFINLAESGFFNGVIFHRVMPDFVIQAGGFLSDGTQKTASNIPWENTGHKNDKYTVAMARSGDANDPASSGTGSSQFFINLKDNPSLDGYTYPYVVFGKVIEGQNVVDAIGVLPTGTHNDMDNWPNDPPVINSVTIER
jgi:cyclophilin family peptidyl-prolyl cis-trans isomerase